MTVLRVGKHKGKSYSAVAESDRSYCSWVLRLGSHSTSSGLDKFASYLKKNHGGILPIGRHKGKFYKEIIEEDSDYCSWASQIEKPGDPLKDFVHYLKLHWKESDRDREDSNAKGSEECKICFSAAISTVLQEMSCMRRTLGLSNVSTPNPRRRSRCQRSNSPPSDFVGKLRASAGSPYSRMG